MMPDVIYTVESGEYSDHCIHGFCTTLEEAQKIARAVLAKRKQDYGHDVEPGYYDWPVVFANPVNVPCSYLLCGREIAERVKWCDEDQRPQ